MKLKSGSQRRKRNKMKKVVIDYSADFRTDTVANQIYGHLRDNGFDFLNVRHQYNVKHGTSRVEFSFGDNTLPSKSVLEEKLKGIHPKLRIDVIGSNSRAKDA